MTDIKKQTISGDLWMRIVNVMAIVVISLVTYSLDNARISIERSISNNHSKIERNEETIMEAIKNNTRTDTELIEFRRYTEKRLDDIANSIQVLSEKLDRLIESQNIK